MDCTGSSKDAMTVAGEVGGNTSLVVMNMSF